MRRIGFGLAIGGALAIALWLLWPRADDIGAALPAETVSVAVLADPAALARRVDAITGPLDGRLGALDNWFARADRVKTLGFDPTTGFEAIGVGPRGGAIARLSALKYSVICLDLVDRARFSRWLARQTGQDTRFDATVFVAGAYERPWVERAGWTCWTGSTVPRGDLLSALESDERLADAPLYAALGPGPGLRGAWNTRQATRWAHSVGRQVLATDLVHLAAYVSNMAARLGDAIDVRIDLTDEGQALADRLFHPGATRFKRFLAREGWAAARLSLALESAPDALATFLPPSTPMAQRQAISLGRMALPMTAGISWNQLVAALSGQIAMGVDLRVEGTKPPRLLLLGVKDKAAAQTALEAMARKFGEGGGIFGMGAAKTETIAGVTAYRLHFDAGDAWVHLADDAVVVGSTPEALALALSGDADGAPAWAALDRADAVLALAGDVAALKARLPEALPGESLAPRLGVAITRAAKTLDLKLDAASGVSPDALIAVGLWLAGRR